MLISIPICGHHLSAWVDYQQINNIILYYLSRAKYVLVFYVDVQLQVRSVLESADAQRTIVHMRADGRISHYRWACQVEVLAINVLFQMADIFRLVGAKWALEADRTSGLWRGRRSGGRGTALQVQSQLGSEIGNGIKIFTYTCFLPYILHLYMVSLL